MCFSIFLINIELFQRSLKKPFQKCPRFPPKNLHGICFKNPPEVASGILQRNRKSFHGIFAWIPLKFYYFFLYIQGFFKKILDIFIYKFFHRFLQIISHGFLHKRLKLLFQKTSLGFPQKFLRGFFRKMFHDFFLEFAPACKKFRIPSKISPNFALEKNPGIFFLNSTREYFTIFVTDFLANLSSILSQIAP